MSWAQLKIMTTTFTNTNHRFTLSTIRFGSPRSTLTYLSRFGSLEVVDQHSTLIQAS